jgi:DNA-binding LacI/PurR family transcriptional regulator
VAHSDGLILAGEDIPDSVTKAIAASNKPVMSFQDSQAEDAYVNFFNTNFL